MARLPEVLKKRSGKVVPQDTDVCGPGKRVASGDMVRGGVYRGQIRVVWPVDTRAEECFYCHQLAEAPGKRCSRFVL